MDSIEKWVLTVSGVIGWVFSYLIDGLGKAVVFLAIMMAIDYVTGLVQAIYNKNLSSEIGYKGLVKKVYFLLLVCACYLMENLLFNTRQLSDGVTTSFVVMEFVSIIENGVRMNVPFTGVFRAFLAIVKKKGEGEK